LGIGLKPDLFCFLNANYWLMTGCLLLIGLVYFHELRKTALSLMHHCAQTIVVEVRMRLDYLRLLLDSRNQNLFGHDASGPIVIGNLLYFLL
jgi:hypothetical protein